MNDYESMAISRNPFPLSRLSIGSNSRIQLFIPRWKPQVIQFMFFPPRISLVPSLDLVGGLFPMGGWPLRSGWAFIAAQRTARSGSMRQLNRASAILGEKGGKLRKATRS
jgi:hypothetical protein